jgi:hypothetical protein
MPLLENKSSRPGDYNEVQFSWMLKLRGSWRGILAPLNQDLHHENKLRLTNANRIPPEDDYISETFRITAWLNSKS